MSKLLYNALLWIWTDAYEGMVKEGSIALDEDGFIKEIYYSEVLDKSSFAECIDIQKKLILPGEC